MGSKSTKTTQENKPPAWAEPLLRTAAKDAKSLYDQGKGYNTYTGPTMAALSDPTLSGMNSLLAATGYSGAPISNQSVSSLVPDMSNMLEEVRNRNAAPQQQQSRPNYTTDIKEATSTGTPYAAKFHNLPGLWVQQKTPNGEQWVRVDGEAPSSAGGLW